MPEDIAPVEVTEETPAPPATTETEEEVIEEVVDARIEEVCADMLERIDMLEAQVGELHARFTGYSTTEHNHGTISEAEPPTPTNGAGAGAGAGTPDEQPTPTHFYFRRIGE